MDIYSIKYILGICEEKNYYILYKLSLSEKSKLSHRH